MIDLRSLSAILNWMILNSQLVDGEAIVKMAMISSHTYVNLRVNSQSKGFNKFSATSDESHDSNSNVPCQDSSVYGGVRVAVCGYHHPCYTPKESFLVR